MTLQTFCPSCGRVLDISGKCQSCETSAPSSSGVFTKVHAGLDPKAAAFFCYSVPFFGPIFFLHFYPYSQDRTVRFQAWQAALLHLGAVLIYAAMMFFFLAMGLITNWFLAGTDVFGIAALTGLFSFTLLVVLALDIFLNVIAGLCALRGRCLRIPLVAQLADRFCRSVKSTS